MAAVVALWVVEVVLVVFAVLVLMLGLNVSDM